MIIQAMERNLQFLSNKDDPTRSSMYHVFFWQQNGRKTQAEEGSLEGFCYN